MKMFFFLTLVAGTHLLIFHPNLSPEKPKAPPAPTPALQQPCPADRDRQELLLIVKGEDYIINDDSAMAEELEALNIPAVQPILEKHATQENINVVHLLVRLKKDYAERHPELVGK